jgi:hypothetical protein
MGIPKPRANFPETRFRDGQRRFYRPDGQTIEIEEKQEEM